jgi:hypothetical protein
MVESAADRGGVFLACRIVDVEDRDPQPRIGQRRRASHQVLGPCSSVEARSPPHLLSLNFDGYRRLA